jgi:hypothetical protein
MRKLTLKLAVLSLLTFACSCSLLGPSTASLQVEAQIIYKVGGPQPVARDTFLLLDTDVDKLPETQESLKASRGDLLIDRLKRIDFFLNDGKSILERHKVQSGQTDFKGQITFENVKPGDYWVFGIAETRTDMRPMIWNVKTTVKPGENKLVLSNDNSGF